jgi:hypothetical protein
VFAYFRILRFINRKKTSSRAQITASGPAVTLTIQPDPLARSSTRVCGVLYKVPAVPHISPPPAEDPRSPLSFVSRDPSSPAATTPPMAGLGSKALAVVAVLAAVVLSVASAAEAPAPSPVSAAAGASAPFAAALVASSAAFLFAAVRH